MKTKTGFSLKHYTLKDMYSGKICLQSITYIFAHLVQRFILESVYDTRSGNISDKYFNAVTLFQLFRNQHKLHFCLY